MQINLKTLLTGAGIAFVSYQLARAALRAARWFDYQGKSVIVTGGSRGLGLCLARQLVKSGANVTICARTPLDIRA